MNKKSWYICTMEYYLTLKKEEILSHATTRTHLEDLVLSEIRDKNTLCLVPRVVQQKGAWWLSGARERGKWRIV